MKQICTCTMKHTISYMYLLYVLVIISQSLGLALIRVSIIIRSKPCRKTGLNTVAGGLNTVGGLNTIGGLNTVWGLNTVGALIP